MLKHLHISNYALISQLDIDFSAGLSTLTGETGAGKSIIIGALGLLLGARADSKTITEGEQKCVIEGEFSIEGYGLEPLFADYDLDYSPICTVRRELLQNGKSRSFINDTPVNLAPLKALSTRLLDIHSQHENLLLTDTAFQLRLIDTVAQDDPEKTAYTDAYETYRRTQSQLQTLREEAAKAAEEADFIAFRCRELDDAHLIAGEENELAAEEQTLAHAEDIRTNLFEAAALLDADTAGVLTTLRNCVSHLRAVGPYLNDNADLAERTESARLELQDIADTAARLAENTEADPARLTYVQERLDTLNALLQKHRVSSTNDLISLHNQLREQMSRNDSYQLDINRLTKQLAAETARLQTCAKALHERRTSVLANIKKRLESQLTQLAITHAQVEIRLNPTPDFTPTGSDEAQILFAANKNQSLRPVQDVASGGEIARLMLCLKALTADRQPTIIFDEIDTGVSGEVASRMGEIMRQMATDRQIIAITHLPQIAAKGQHHFCVFKQDNDRRTETQIRQLTPEERVTEIAKMLSGNTLTPAALDNARQLLNCKSSIVNRQSSIVQL